MFDFMFQVSQVAQEDPLIAVPFTVTSFGFMESPQLSVPIRTAVSRRLGLPG